MAKKPRHPVTSAIRVLRTAGIDFTPRMSTYIPRGGTAHTAETLGVDEHRVIKTLIMEDENQTPLVILMHGDCSVSTKALARQIGVKSVTPCDPAVAQKHSGYQVGGTSPFGTRRTMPVYIERTITALPELIINGGKRGFMVALSGVDLVAVLQPIVVDVALC